MPTRARQDVSQQPIAIFRIPVSRLGPRERRVLVHRFFFSRDSQCRSSGFIIIETLVLSFNK